MSSVIEHGTFNKTEILTFLLENNLYSLSRQIDPEKFFRQDDTYLITSDGIYYFFENMKTRYRTTLIKLDIEAYSIHKVVPGRTDKTFNNKNRSNRF